MLTIEREIASQPEVWRRSAELAEAQRAPLPAAGERVALPLDPNFPRHLTRSVVLK